MSAVAPTTGTASAALTKRPGVNGLALYAWTTILPPGERLLAFDWQHLCYRWQPHEHAVQGAEWLIEPFPESDFRVFLTEDFAAGTFGDPLRYTLCVFGADLLRTLGPALSCCRPGGYGADAGRDPCAARQRRPTGCAT